MWRGRGLREVDVAISFGNDTVATRIAVDFAIDTVTGCATDRKGSHPSRAHTLSIIDEKTKGISSSICY